MRYNWLRVKGIVVMVFVSLAVGAFWGCSSSAVLSRHSSSEKSKISAVSQKAKPKNRTCDMRIQIKIKDPIAPYLSDFGTVELFGPGGIKITKRFPVKFGTQVVIIPDLEPGRYNVQVSYGDLVATKCVVLGCVCIDNWKEVFARATMEELKKDSKTCASCSKGITATGFAAGNYGWTGGVGGNYWGGYSNSSWGWGSSQKELQLKGTGELKPPCSLVTPCGHNVSFEFPKDAKE